MFIIPPRLRGGIFINTKLHLKDNAATRRRLPRSRRAGIRRMLQYAEEADDPLVRGRA